MTDQEMQIAIAEACGWEYRDGFVIPFGADRPEKIWFTPDGKGAKSGLPDYPNDLNAMAEAKQTLTDDEQEQYPFELLGVLGIDCDEPCTPRELFIALSATAKQEAQAFLKTKGIWKD